MKNKKLLFIGVLTAFLMLAVPFAVISFDADDVVAADGDSTGEITVTDEDSLKGALLNSSINIIKVQGMIELSKGLVQVERSVKIAGIDENSEIWYNVPVLGIYS